MNKSISIVLRSGADTSGFSRISSAVKRLMGDVDGAAAGVRKLGKAFGTLGGLAGATLANILRGGIWGAMGEGVRLVVGWFGKLKKEAERAEEEIAKLAEQSKTAGKAVEDSFKAIGDSSAKAVSGIDALLKKRNEEIDKVKELTKAEIELQKQRAVANGGDAAPFDRKLADLDRSAASEKAENSVEAAELRLKEAERARRSSLALLLRTRNALAERRRAAGGMEAEVEKKAKEHAAAYARPEKGVPLLLSEDYAKTLKAARERGLAELHESAEWRKAQELVKIAEKQVAAAEKHVAEVSDKAVEERRRELELANVEKSTVAKKNAAAELAAVRERSAAELAAQKAAAQERDRLDRELHRKRMDYLRAELAEQSKKAQDRTANMRLADTEFDRAFAMYRDPSRAAADIGEEKAYAADLDRLHRDADRYGGKWRIDELSRLMSAGDVQGVQATLEEWRKSKGFSAQVESMVRASAAEKSRATAEDELRKISKNTADLAEKIDDLLRMKES